MAAALLGAQGQAYKESARLAVGMCHRGVVSSKGGIIIITELPVPVVDYSAIAIAQIGEGDLCT